MKYTHLFFIAAQQGPFHEMKITPLDASIFAKTPKDTVEHISVP